MEMPPTGEDIVPPLAGPCQLPGGGFPRQTVDDPHPGGPHPAPAYALRPTHECVIRLLAGGVARRIIIRCNMVTTPAPRRMTTAHAGNRAAQRARTAKRARRDRPRAQRRRRAPRTSRSAVRETGRKAGINAAGRASINRSISRRKPTMSRTTRWARRPRPRRRARIGRNRRRQSSRSP
jgi:hypothetical protein